MPASHLCVTFSGVQSTDAWHGTHERPSHLVITEPGRAVSPAGLRHPAAEEANVRYPPAEEPRAHQRCDRRVGRDTTADAPHGEPPLVAPRSDQAVAAVERIGAGLRGRRGIGLRTAATTRSMDGAVGLVSQHMTRSPGTRP